MSKHSYAQERDSAKGHWAGKATLSRKERAMGCSCCGHDAHDHDEDEKKPCSCCEADEEDEDDDDEDPAVLKKKILISAILLVAAVIVTRAWEFPLLVQFIFFLPSYLVAGGSVLKEAGENIVEGHPFDEDFLMAVATVGALLIGFIPGGEPMFAEAVFVMLFFQVGELFEGIAEGNSRCSISQLMDIRPDTANVERDGEVKVVDPDDVEVGETIVIRPGEKVPMDGVILEGSSSLNTVAITGESAPRDVIPGDAIISGCVNVSGVLRVKVMKAFGESTAAKILDLVEHAGQSKSRSENFITRFAKVYTPIVVYAAIAVAFLPPLFSGDFGANFATWLLRALTFLVVSCPCALVLSVPLTFFGGIGGASKQGILIKGSTFMDALATADTIVFDKTGTLTEAQPRLARVLTTDGWSKDDVLRLSACLEEHFPHPVARAVVNAAKTRGLEHRERHAAVEYIVAHGIASSIEGRRAVIGSAHFVFEDEHAHLEPGVREGIESEMQGFSPLYLSVDGEVVGVLGIEDPLKAGVKEAIAELHALGVKHVVMLTGDSERTACRIAREAGVDEYGAELLPEDKYAYVEKIKAEGRRVAMVGDGVNDSPALGLADVGLAMGGGSDIAKEVADIILSDTDLEAIVRLRRMSQGLIDRLTGSYSKVMLTNSALLALGIAGVIAPQTSSLLHNGSTIAYSLGNAKAYLPAAS